MPLTIPKSPSSAKSAKIQKMNDAVRSSVSEDDVVHHVSSPGDGISDTNTPKRRKVSGNSASPRQKDFARKADPGGGHCLLTRRSEPVQACHLVATRTGDTILTRLENAWGLPHRTFNVDTRYNLLFLRSDWHFLFDQRKFMLIPQMEDLEELERLTVSQTSTGDVEPVDVNTVWKDRTTFKYHLLATPQLKEPICRFLGPEAGAAHQTYHPPYVDLGSLISHVRPHFVVVNSAQKVTAKDERFLARTLAEVSGNVLTGDTIILIKDLYRRWIESSRGGSESGGRDDAINRSSSGPPPNRDGAPPESSDRGHEGSRNQQREADSNRPQNPSPGDQQDAVESLSPDSEDETAIGDGDQTMSDDTAWVEEIIGWAKGCSEAASEVGWEPDILNDGQVVEYAKEEPLRAPPAESWQDSVPRFKPSNVPGKFWDTEQFCSNDWVVYHGWRPLFGRGR